jgi:hypothetical protein
MGQPYFWQGHPQHPSVRRMGGPQSRSRCRGVGMYFACMIQFVVCSCQPCTSFLHNRVASADSWCHLGTLLLLDWKANSHMVWGPAIALRCVACERNSNLHKLMSNSNQNPNHSTCLLVMRARNRASRLRLHEMLGTHWHWNYVVMFSEIHILIMFTFWITLIHTYDLFCVAHTK